MEQLVQEIVNLEDQEQEIKNRLSLAETDEEGRKITDELNYVMNQLSMKRDELTKLQAKEAEKQAVIEYKVQGEGIPFAIAGVDFSGLEPAVITLIDLVVRADRRRLLNEHAIELEQAEQRHASDMKIADAREGQLMWKNDELQHEINGMLSEFQGYQNQIHQLTKEKQDAESKRDAAVAEMEHFRAELDKATAEIDRLNSQIEDYQRAKVFGERQAQQIIDVTPEENTNINAALEAVKKLYTKLDDWGSVIKVEKPGGGFELVKRAELEAEWAPAVPEVLQFRDEADIAGDESVQPSESNVTSVEPPEVSFQGDPEAQQPSADEPVASAGQIGGEAVTRAEFEELKRRVEGLESRKHPYGEGTAA